MARRRRRYGKKRRYRRKGKRGKPNTTIVRGPSVIGDQAIVKLHYEELDTAIVSLGAMAVQTYRANSLYDPDATGIGAQPMGFDQWANFFNRYQVKACKIEFQMLPDPTIVPPSHAVAVVVPTDKIASLTGVLQAAELPYSKSKIIPSQSIKPTFINNYLSTRAKFGYSTSIDQEDDLSSTTTTNPTEQWFWSLAVGALNGTGNVNLQYKVRITYYVRFFDRLDLLRS